MKLPTTDNPVVIIKPPEPIDWRETVRTIGSFRSIFLAGSIEMGAAERWQDRVVKDLSVGKQLYIYNPRRDDWDSTWKQNKDNKQFYEQVNWELNGMHCADIIAMYFAPKTVSPISLMELGLHAATGKVIVFCPPEFERKGNVDIVCQQYGVPVHENYDTWILNIKQALQLI